MPPLASAKSGEALGQSEAFLEFQERISRVAPVERPVLLIGERGTGKELAAGRLHYLSRRWEGPFITLNCSTLSPALIESELFGHERGAFTGAETARAGRFESAHGGTLFLDEIGTIPIEAQEKILRVVEYGSFERVGSSRSIETDVRIICATNADLPAMAERGAFKRDLLDRLSFEVLFLPPLRYRLGDIMLLAHYFAARMALELEQGEAITFSPKACKALEEYSWPGNIRELKNVIERAVYRADSRQIDMIDFNPFTSPYQAAGATETAAEIMSEPASPPSADASQHLPNRLSFQDAVSSFEVALIKKALEQARYNRARAAASLGLTYDRFRGLLRKYRGKLNI